jgi:S-adenosylmethionine synthetase
MNQTVQKFFTSESVTEGHPDKLCDQVSDAILDAYLIEDPYAKCAIECMATGNTLIIAGEVASEAVVNVEEEARKTIRKIGYTDSSSGFSDQCEIQLRLQKQSRELNTNASRERPGAGDQGMMFGYACDHTDEYMPVPIYLAQRLARQLTLLRKTGSVPGLQPDGKTQVTMCYSKDGFYIKNVVIATQHSPEASTQEISKILWPKMIQVIPAEFLNAEFPVFINAAGDFITGGPAADTGLTGRKIIVDTYGGWARHGGGAFSGKDSTKVDRSGSYMARFIAKNVVASLMAKECEIQLAFVIGEEKPISVRVDTFGSGTLPDAEIESYIDEKFDMSVYGIIEQLQLRRPVYKQVASYGHFGRSDLNLSWEKIIKID